MDFFCAIYKKIFLAILKKKILLPSYFPKTAKNYTKFVTSERGQKYFFIIFASFGGMVSIKFFSKTKNGQVMNKKNLFWL